MNTTYPRLILTWAGALLWLAGLPLLRAQTDEQAFGSPDDAIRGITTETFDALSLIQGGEGDAYSVPEVERLFRAVWWDVTCDAQEVALARRLNGTERPIVILGGDGRALSFTKVAAPDAMRQQRFLLPSHFTPADSTYFVHAFKNTKYAGVYVGACRVHELADRVMATALNDMINQARFQARTAGEQVVLKLFSELEAGYRDANPAIRGEFADAVRRIVGRYSSDPRALPAAVRKAAWLQPPPG